MATIVKSVHVDSQFKKKKKKVVHEQKSITECDFFSVVRYLKCNALSVGRSNSSRLSINNSQQQDLRRK
jgi:hypothetical protein